MAGNLSLFFCILAVNTVKSKPMKLFSTFSKKSWTPDDESSLIAACLAGDRLAQKALFEKYHQKMLAVCLRYLPQYDQAEDTLAQAFVRLFENLHRYRHEGSFEGWIRRIVTNEALGELRKKKKLYFEDIESADWNGHSSPACTQLETQDLLALIQQLPEGYRTVFNLYVVDGYSHQEIAQQLGISENTSKSQLSRARSLLQKWIQRQENPLLNS
jgi:RNA polymerase sigma factor (sigma-70 family)